MTINKSELLILMPALNEASIIGEVIFHILRAGYLNICVINDGSSDETAQVAIDAGAIVLTHPINRGAGAAIQTGIEYAKKQGFQYAMTMDGDGQHLAEDIGKLCKKMEETAADIVIGDRFSQNNNNIPKHRIAYNRLADILTNIFCKNNYLDTQSGLRLFNREAMEIIHLKGKGFAYSSEVFIIADQNKLQVEAVPIGIIYSDYSLSKGQNASLGFKTAINFLSRVIFG